jgi:hypothetical protein
MIKYRFLVPGLIFETLAIVFLSGNLLQISNWIIGGACWLLTFFLLVKAFSEDTSKVPIKESIIGIPMGGVKKIKPVRFEILFLILTIWISTFFYFEKQNWLFGIIGLALFVMLVVLSKMRTEITKSPNSKDKSNKYENYLLWFLIIFSSLLRFPWIYHNFVGLQADEGALLLNTWSIMKGKLLSPFTVIWSNNPSFTYFILAQFLHILGFKLAMARAVTALVAVLTIWVFFKWCRFYFDVMASFLATFLFSISWWNLFFSMSLFHAMYTNLFEVSTFYFLEKGFRRKKAIDFALSGLFIAASVMSYISGRLVPIMILVVILSLIVINGKKFLQSYLKYLVLLALSTLLLLGPFLVLVFHQPSVFFARSEQLNIFKLILKTKNFLLPLKTTFWTIYTLFFPNVFGIDCRFDLPLNPGLDIVTGFFGFMGLILTIRSIRKNENIIFIVGFLAGVIANSFAIEGPNPNPAFFKALRCFLILPFLFLMVATAFQWLIQWEKEHNFGKIYHNAIKGILIVLLIISCVINFNIYFFKFRNSEISWSDLGFNHLRAASIYKKYYPQNKVITYWAFDSVVEKVMNDFNHVKVTSVNHLQLPLHVSTSKNVALVIPNGLWMNQLSKIRQLYPRAKWKYIKNRFGQQVFFVITIPHDELIS